MTHRMLLRDTAAVVRAFADGRADLEEVQAKLQSVMALLERTDDSSEVARVLRDVEGDLELIRFTVFGDRVRPAAMAALDPLLPHLAEHTRPSLDGDAVVSVDTEHGVLIDTAGGWSIRIEGDCTLHRSGDTIDVVDEQFHVLEEALALWEGATLGRLDYGTDGGLVVTCGADRLVVRPSEDFEAWGIAGPRQEKIISLPGGTVSTWDGA